MRILFGIELAIAIEHNEAPEFLLSSQVQIALRQAGHLVAVEPGDRSCSTVSKREHSLKYRLLFQTTVPDVAFPKNPLEGKKRCRVTVGNHHRENSHSRLLDLTCWLDASCSLHECSLTAALLALHSSSQCTLSQNHLCIQFGMEVIARVLKGQDWTEHGCAGSRKVCLCMNNSQTFER
jgi:hypothetical protein